MMRLRLGFAVLWALMLHAMVVLGWLSAPAEQERNPNIADANDPMPMVEVALTAPPSPTLDAIPTAQSSDHATPPAPGVDPPAPRARTSAERQQWEYEQRLRAYLAARANLAAQDSLVGQAQLRFSVRADGVLSSVQVLRADSPAVAAAAVALLRDAAPLPRPPKLLHLQVPVQFRG